ncbi:hypothetical protein [Flavobacterium sp. XS2P39]
MKNYSNSVMAELESQLKITYSNEDNLVHCSQQAIKVTIAVLLTRFFYN